MKVKVDQSCQTLWRPHGLYSPRNSPGQNTGVGSCSLLRGITPTQRLNLGLPHCRQILYQLSHKGSLNNTLEGINSKITEAEEWINDLKNRMVEITAAEQNIEKRMKRNEDNLRDLRDNIKYTNIHRRKRDREKTEKTLLRDNS